MVREVTLCNRDSAIPPTGKFDLREGEGFRPSSLLIYLFIIFILVSEAPMFAQAYIHKSAYVLHMVLLDPVLQLEALLDKVYR